MRQELQTILTLVPKLTPAECAQVASAMKAAGVLGPVKAVADEGTSDELWVLQSITKWMQDRAFDLSGIEQLKKTAGYKSFREKVPPVVSYIRRIGKDRNTQRAFLNIGIELLHEDLITITIAATSRTMMLHSHRIPAVLNRAFPGYLQAGLMHMILRKR